MSKSMSKPRKAITAERLEPLRQQLRGWRKERKGPGPMPEGLWGDAVALAREFGVCPIARALAVDYTSLRRRVERAVETGLVKPTFVQLPATVASAPPPTTIEISTPNGSRMRINLESGRGMEAASIVAAFLESRG